MLNRLFHDLDKFLAHIGFLLRLRVAFGHGHARFVGQYLDRLDEIDVLGLAHKGDRVALGVAAEAIIKSLAVIHMEACGLFLMERAGRPKVALGLIGLAGVPHDLAPDDLSQ